MQLQTFKIFYIDKNDDDCFNVYCKPVNAPDAVTAYDVFVSKNPINIKVKDIQKVT